MTVQIWGDCPSGDFFQIPFATFENKQFPICLFGIPQSGRDEEEMT